jgi:hypothetical protein
LREGDVVVLRAGSLLRSGDAVTPLFVDKQQTAAQTPPSEAR